MTDIQNASEYRDDLAKKLHEKRKRKRIPIIQKSGKELAKNFLLEEEKTQKYQSNKIKHRMENFAESLSEPDKKNLLKVLDRLKNNNMYTNENIKKLLKIRYNKDSIEIGGVLWSRKTLDIDVNKGYEEIESGHKFTKIYKTIQNGKDNNNINNIVYKEKLLDEERKFKVYTYFESLAGTLEAKKQGVAIPTTKQVEGSLKALPGNYENMHGWNKGGNILGIILGLGHLPGYINEGEVTDFKKISAFPVDDFRNTFSFDKDNGLMSHTVFYMDTMIVCPVMGAQQPKGQEESEIKNKIELQENINDIEPQYLQVPLDESHISSHLNELSYHDIIYLTNTKLKLEKIKKVLEENENIDEKDLFLFKKAEEIYKKDGLLDIDIFYRAKELFLEEYGELDWKDCENTEFYKIWSEGIPNIGAFEIRRDHKKLFYLKAITCENSLIRGNEKQIIEGEDKDKRDRLYTNLIHNKDNRHLNDLVDYIKDQPDYKENLQLNYADVLGIPKEHQFNIKKDVEVEGQKIKLIAQGFFDKNNHYQNRDDAGKLRSNGKYIVGEKNREKYLIYDNGMSEHRFIAEKNGMDDVLGGGWMTINSDGIKIYGESYVYGKDPDQESGFTKKVFENILKK